MKLDNRTQTTKGTEHGPDAAETALARAHDIIARGARVEAETLRAELIAEKMTLDGRIRAKQTDPRSADAAGVQLARVRAQATIVNDALTLLKGYLATAAVKAAQRAERTREMAQAQDGVREPQSDVERRRVSERFQARAEIYEMDEIGVLDDINQRLARGDDMLHVVGWGTKRLFVVWEFDEDADA